MVSCIYGYDTYSTYSSYIRYEMFDTEHYMTHPTDGAAIIISAGET